MFIQTPLVVNFNYYLLKTLFEEKGKMMECSFLAEILPSTGTEKLNISKALRNYMHNKNIETVHNQIAVNLLFILKSDESEQVRSNCTFGLIHLALHSSNKNILIELSKAMDTDTTLIKSIIVNNMEEISEVDSKTANYILQKAMNDNHFYIRQSAE